MHTLAQRFLSQRKRRLFYTRVLSAATRSVAHSASSPLRSSARCAEVYQDHFSPILYPFSAIFRPFSPSGRQDSREYGQKAREKNGGKIEKNSGERG